MSGVRTDWLNLALAVLTGATITLSMRVVGVLLIGAMLVIPVLVGLRAARGLRAAMATAVLAGVLSAVAGLTVAFYGDLSAGGSIVLTALLAPGASESLGPLAALAPQGGRLGLLSTNQR